MLHCPARCDPTRKKLCVQKDWLFTGNEIGNIINN